MTPQPTTAFDRAAPEQTPATTNRPDVQDAAERDL